MTVPTDLAGFFRTQWATRYVDTCHVQRQTGTSLNTGTGVETPTYADVYGTSGTPAACLIRPKAATDTQTGEQQTELREYLVFIPHDETGPTAGDIITITSTNDALLNGSTFTIRNVAADTYNHTRRLTCEEAVNG